MGDIQSSNPLIAHLNQSNFSACPIVYWWKKKEKRTVVTENRVDFNDFNKT